mmetsp:Transcript_36399/g.86136  ORF Transcript_36399/g.86136 Transcript_36399/m.86136 type:complete len:214 (+) Transcript_36399:1-642(+)
MPAEGPPRVGMHRTQAAGAGGAVGVEGAAWRCRGPHEGPCPHPARCLAFARLGEGRRTLASGACQQLESRNQHRVGVFGGRVRREEVEALNREFSRVEDRCLLLVLHAQVQQRTSKLELGNGRHVAPGDARELLVTLRGDQARPVGVGHRENECHRLLRRPQRLLRAARGARSPSFVEEGNRLAPVVRRSCRQRSERHTCSERVALTRHGSQP